MFLVGLPILSLLVCGISFLLAQMMAMWSTGRARRAHRISKVLAGLWVLPVVFTLVGAFLPNAEELSSDIIWISLAWSACFVGALWAVRMCAGGARREIEAAVVDADNPGFTRASL